MKAQNVCRIGVGKPLAKDHLEEHMRGMKI
jgi:hypothetical protein